MKDARTETVVEEARIRNWRSGNHCPYPGMLHDKTTDDKVDWQEKIYRLLWDLPEGALVSIAVTFRLPEESDVEEDDYWELLRAHHYGHHRSRGSVANASTSPT